MVHRYAVVIGAVLSGLRGTLLLPVLLVAALLAVPHAALPAAAAACAPPANDSFGAAVPLGPGWDGSIAVVTCGATSQPGEPVQGRGDSVWYTWTAPHDMTMLFRTEHTDGIRVQVWTGDTVSGLSPVADDVYSGDLTEKFRTVRGSTYRIQVTSYEGPGDGTLVWRHFTPPNDHAYNALWMPAADQPPHARSGRHLVDNIGATTVAGDPPLAAGQSGGTLWFGLEPVVHGTLTVDLSGSEADTVVGLFRLGTDGALTRVAVAQGGGSTDGAARLVAQVAGGDAEYRVLLDSMGDRGGMDLAWRLRHPRPPNDHFADATKVTGGSGEARSWLWSASRQAGEPAHNGVGTGRTIWWVYEAPKDGRLTVSTVVTEAFAAYRGSSVGSLTRVPVERQRSWPTHAMSFVVRAGLRYHVALGTDPNLPAGTAGIDWELGPLPPANDDYDDARVITGASGTLSQTTVGATAEYEHGDSAGQATVWYRWRATHTGWETFTTTGSLAATALVGHQPSGTFWEFSYGDGSSDLHSAAWPGRYATRHLRVVEGTTYRLRLSTSQERAHQVRLTWSRTGPPGRPAHDDLAGASVVTGSAGSLAGQRPAGATYQPGESALLDECIGSCPYDQGDHGGSVWYRWTAPASGTVRFTTGADGPAGWFSLYRSSGTVGGLVDVGEPVIGTPGRAYSGSVLDRPVTAGQTYVLRYGATESRPFTLTWVLTPGAPVWPAGPGNDHLGAATTLQGERGEVTGSGTWSTLQAGEPVRAERPVPWTVWYRWTAPRSGLATIGVAQPSSALVNVFTGTTLTGLTRQQPTSAGNADRRPTVQVAAGTTYLVQVGDVNGPFTLTWDVAAPPHDDVADALVLDPGPTGSSPYLGVGRATVEAGEPPTAWDQPAQRTVWMSWTPRWSGPVSLDTFGDSHSSMDVFTGTPVAGLTRLGGTSHLVDLDAVAGTRYWIRLNGEIDSVARVHWEQRWDRTAPSASMLLAGGAQSTTSVRVDLRLSGADAHSGLRGWRVSMVAAYGEVLASAWVPASASSRTISWPLTHTGYGGDRRRGTKTVHVQSVDEAGNLSPVRSATVRLE